MKKKGFTLIELLVVIAIIAILAAILFPVFAKAREKGRQTSCLSNERQVMMAILQYAQDWNEKPPLLADMWSGAGWGWEDQILKYHNSRALYVCASYGRAKGSKTQLVSYGMYWCEFKAQYHLGCSCGDIVPVNLPSIENPGSKWSLMETWPGYDHVTACYVPGGGVCNEGDPDCETYCPTEGFSEARHNNGMNVAFWDGHAEWFHKSKYDPAAGNHWWDMGGDADSLK